MHIAHCSLLHLCHSINCRHNPARSCSKAPLLLQPSNLINSNTLLNLLLLPTICHPTQKKADKHTPTPLKCWSSQSQAAAHAARRTYGNIREALHPVPAIHPPCSQLCLKDPNLRSLPRLSFRPCKDPVAPSPQVTTGKEQSPVCEQRTRSPARGTFGDR